MSLLSDFQSKTYQGLSSAGLVLTFEKSRAEFRLHATDAAGSGATYPRLVLSNSYAAAGSASEVHFEGPNSSVADVVIAKIRGVMATYTAGAEVGALSLLAKNSNGSFRGVAVWESALVPDTDGLVALGTASLGYDALHLYDTGSTARAYLEPGAPTTLYFSSAVFQLRSQNKTYNMAVTETGVGVFNPAPPTTSLFSVGDSSNSSYFSQASGSAAYGINVSLGAPSNVTAEANGLRVSVYSTASVLTVSTAIKVVGVTKGGNSTVTTAYGIYTVAPTAGTSAFDNISYYGLASNSGGWNVVADGGASWFRTMAIRDGAFNRNDAPSSICEILTNQLAFQTIDVLRVTHTGGNAYLGNMVRVLGQFSSSGYNLMVVGDISNTRLLVRGDGLVFVNRNSQLNGGLLSMSGRLSMAGQDVYDLYGSSATVDLHLATTHGVSANLSAQSISVATSLALNGSGASGFGLYAVTTQTAGAAGSYAYGVFGAANGSYASGLRGGMFQATAMSGATGPIEGVLSYVVSQAGTPSSIGVHVYHIGRLNYGFLVNAANPGDQLDYGFYVNNSSAVATAAFLYYQRAGAAGDAFRFVESGGTTRFSITSTGDIGIGGLGRRIKADFSDATTSSRAMFQTSVASGSTIVQALPAGGGSVSGFGSFDGSDADNACRLLSYIRSDGAFLWAAPIGGGTQRSLTIGTGAGIAIGLHINTNTDVQIGPGTLTTGATAGHLYAPSVGGTMTGVPTVRTGWIPVVVDSTGHRLGIFSGGVWKWTAALT